MTDLITRNRIRSQASRKGALTRKIMLQARGDVPSCSRCSRPRDTAGFYCRSCRAEYMREWRARKSPRETVVIRRAA